MTNLREHLELAIGASYHIERELVGGGMSRVFVAREVALDRAVVVKVLPPELGASFSAERFAREVHMSAKLQHPNIVPVLAAGQASDVPYFTMPFVSGESLAVRLARGRVDAADAVAVLRDIARALAYAHEHGIVHRDIKPQNVLLSGGLAVVTDFGIAKALAAAKTGAMGREDASSHLTAVGTSLGTPAYIAPEQAVGGDVDVRADLYAWGLVAYEMLAGAHPFAHRTTPQQLIAAQLSERPMSLASVRKDLPPALSNLVMQCLEKSPDDRPQSAAQILSALAAVDGRASSADRSFWSDRGRVVAAGIGVAAIAVLAWSLVGRRPAQNADDASIAILPFTSETDSADVYFAEGLADELQAALVKVPQLRLLSRTMAKAASLKAAGDARAAGRALNVGSVLEGSVRRGRDHIRVTITLTSVANNRVLWTAPLERSAADVFAIQNAVADSIIGALRLGTKRAGGRNVAGTSDPTAHELYLRARHLWPNRSQLLEEIRLFEQAIARDSNYAEAYAGLGAAWAVINDYELVDFDTAEARATRAALKALALDSTLGEPHAVLGVLQRRGRASKSLAELERAIALDPENGNTHFWYSLSLLATNRVDDALRELRRAHELDPVAGNITNNYAGLLAALGRFSEAEPLVHDVIRENPTYPNAYQQLVGVLAMTNREAAAIDTARHHSPSAVSGASGMAGSQACAFARAGQRDSARAVIRRITVERDAARRANAPVPAGWWSVAKAITHGALGEIDSVLAELPGFATRSGRTPFMFLSPCGGLLLKEPRVREMVARLADGQ
jgi:serine/threonine-protein kinase